MPRLKSESLRLIWSSRSSGDNASITGSMSIPKPLTSGASASGTTVLTIRSS